MLWSRFSSAISEGEIFLKELSRHRKFVESPSLKEQLLTSIVGAFLRQLHVHLVAVVFDEVVLVFRDPFLLRSFSGYRLRVSVLLLVHLAHRR